jgi:hypothetical protein
MNPYQPIPEQDFISVMITLIAFLMVGFLLLGMCFKMAKSFERIWDRKTKK